MSGPEIRFRFEGRPMKAADGDTVAAALLANGVRVFGRSSKYHRPRGYRCGQGHCSACAMRVDGLPGVRTCVTPVRNGMDVEREHAFPTADHDALRVAELLSPLLPPGFYYRWFRHSPRLWGLLERGLARVAGHGQLPSPDALERVGRARCERRRGPSVLVVGGGPAGLSAALSAAEAGADVLLVERDERLGGRVTDPAPERDALIAEATTHPSIELLMGADAIGWYDEGAIAIDRRLDLSIVEPDAVVLATGGYDRGLPFPGWDLPGVMYGTAARRLIDRHSVKPGSRAVILTTDDGGYDAARHLAGSGVEIACIADCRRPGAIGSGPSEAAQDEGMPTIVGVKAARAHGLDRVQALSLLSAEASKPRRYRCDLVCLSTGLRPADDLARQATSRGSLVLSQAGSPPDGRRLWLAGLVDGATTFPAARDQGAKAGAAAAASAART